MKRTILYILIVFFTTKLFSQNVDSLVRRLDENTLQDTERVKLVIKIASNYHKIVDYQKAVFYGEEGLRLATKLKYKKGLNTLYNILGNCYSDIGDLKSALKFRLITLKLREELHNELDIAYAHLNLGNLYFRLNEYSNAIESYNICQRILEKHGDLSSMAICMSNMGSVYGNQGDLKKAEQLCLKSLEIRKKIGDTEGVADAYSNLSVIMMDVKNYKQSLIYAFKTIELCDETGNKFAKAIALSNVGDVYHQMKDYKNAIKYQKEALVLSTEMNSLEMIKVCCELLSRTYLFIGDLKIALAYYETYSSISDSLTNQEGNEAIVEMKTRFETDKRQKEIEILTKDESIRELQRGEQESNLNRQKIFIFSIVAGIFVIIGLFLFILKNAKEKKRINIGLERKNIEIDIQKNRIEEKNIQITDSIDYAKSIQAAILPEERLFKKLFQDHFVIYQPKELVSGDLYWAYSRNDKIYIAVVDCKHKGVPGAFMTLMLYNIIEEIMRDQAFVIPSEIVQQLNVRLIKALHQQDELLFRDYSIDCIVMQIDEQNKALIFSGANSSFGLSDGVDFSEQFTGDTIIGEEGSVFIDKTVHWKLPSTIYLYTDGIKMHSHYKDVIKENAPLSLYDQKQILTKEFTKEQKDDLCIIALVV